MLLQRLKTKVDQKDIFSSPLTVKPLYDPKDTTEYFRRPFTISNKGLDSVKRYITFKDKSNHMFFQV